MLCLCLSMPHLTNLLGVVMVCRYDFLPLYTRNIRVKCMTILYSLYYTYHMYQVSRFYATFQLTEQEHPRKIVSKMSRVDTLI